MKIFERLAEKIRTNKKWFRGTMVALVTALVAIVITIVLLPEAKANAIEDDPVGKTMTYNIPAIAAGSSGIAEINIDITDPDYTYYIVGDGNVYTDVAITINYDLITTRDVPIYLDNVKINMTKDMPILKFAPSTNDNLNTKGSYKIIVKGDCALTSTCVNAIYPVVQAESISARLYELKNYRGDDVNNLENYYDMVTSEFATNVEFTSYEFAEGENKSECSLTITTAQDSYGAAIGTAAGNVDMTAENVVLSDGSGTPIEDLAGNPLSELFEYKPLKPGVQALYGSSGYTGDITVSGALKFTVISNGAGACIGGGGNHIYGEEPKDGGKVTINGGTVYLVSKDVTTQNGTYAVPAIGGGFDIVSNAYGASGQTIINGGSVYIENNGMKFGANGEMPVNANGEELYLFEADYVSDVDENGKLVLESERYEDKYYADIDVTNKYVDVNLEYESVDYSLITFIYEGFGHGEEGLGNNLYFYLPATPLCGLTIDEDSFMEEDVPVVEVWSKNKQLESENGIYWLYGDGIIKLKNIPTYINIDSFIVTDTETMVPTDYTSALKYDEETGEYTIAVKILSGSEISIRYSSNISIDYNYGFVDGDTHEVVNNSPAKYDLGGEVVLDDSFVAANDLVFAGWYSELTGGRVTNINDSNLESIMDENGHIKLKAKWKVKVIYDFGEGTGEEIPEILIPYGEQSDIVLSDVVPTLDYHIFEGWLVDGQLQGAGFVWSVTPLSDVVISASYLQNSYFVYIDAAPKKFNSENVDIYVGLNGSPITDENNCMLKEADGSYTTKEINGVTYYVAVADNEANIAIIITPKPGHIISGQNIIVTEGKGDQMVFGAVGGQDGGLTVQLTIDQDDIYISTNSEFALREYNITFFDGMSERGGEQLWADSDFVYTIADLDKPIGEILGDKLNEINTINNRFFVFKGWKDKLTGKIYSNEDALMENLGDVILVAQWEEMEKYPLDVTVVDSKTGEASSDVVAIPYYVKEDGSLEAMYEEDEILYAKKNDNIKVVFYYYDNEGNLKELTEGIVLDGMDISYTKPNDSSLNEGTGKGVDYFTYPQPKTGTGVKVTANITVTEYNIMYWDTKGIEHKNPTTYTFFEEVVFENLAENVGWLLVTPDDNDDNYDDIMTKPITKVERGSVGNLVLKADWNDYKDATYKVLIDELIENGKVEIVQPVGKDEYLANETLMIKVTPNPGYKLKNNVITYRKMQDVSIETPLVAAFAVNSTTAMYGAVEITGSDGVYMVDVPEMDIIITAVFEIEKYTITYNGVGDLKNDNVTTFTYFDTVELLPLEKEGYDFVGWVDADGNSVSKIVNGTSDIVLTPVFEKTAVIPNDGTEETTDKATEETTDSKVTIVPDAGDASDSEEETTKPHLVGGGNAYGGETYTGDTSNVTRLVLICVAAVLVLFIVVLSKGKNDEED